MLGYKTSLKPFKIEMLSSFLFNHKIMKLEKKMAENKKKWKKKTNIWKLNNMLPKINKQAKINR